MRASVDLEMAIRLRARCCGTSAGGTRLPGSGQIRRLCITYRLYDDLYLYGGCRTFCCSIFDVFGV
jgi:hypothetical protein